MQLSEKEKELKEKKKIIIISHIYAQKECCTAAHLVEFNSQSTRKVTRKPKARHNSLDNKTGGKAIITANILPHLILQLFPNNLTKFIH